MWKEFLKGRTHDLYGLLFVIVVQTFMTLTAHQDVKELLDVMTVAVSAGVFADLWAHCFHH